jgi:hypothetical protein
VLSSAHARPEEDAIPFEFFDHDGWEVQRSEDDRLHWFRSHLRRGEIQDPEVVQIMSEREAER